MAGEIFAIKAEVRRVQLGHASIEIGGDLHAEIPMPEGGWVPVVNILYGGEKIGDAGLRTRKAAAALSRSSVEIEVAQILHVLAGTIRGGELDEPCALPERVPPGDVFCRIRVGQRGFDAGLFSPRTGVVRTGDDHAEMAVGRGFEGDRDRAGTR